MWSEFERSNYLFGACEENNVTIKSSSKSHQGSSFSAMFNTLCFSSFWKVLLHSELSLFLRFDCCAGHTSWIMNGQMVIIPSLAKETTCICSISMFGVCSYCCLVFGLFLIPGLFTGSSSCVMLSSRW